MNFFYQVQCFHHVYVCVLTVFIILQQQKYLDITNTVHPCNNNISSFQSSAGIDEASSSSKGELILY